MHICGDCINYAAHIQQSFKYYDENGGGDENKIVANQFNLNNELKGLRPCID